MRYVLALLAVAGLIVSGLALHVHKMDPGLAPPCAVDGHWDCGAVNHSRFAVFPPRVVGEDDHSGKLHIPVATLGIAAYSILLILSLMGRLVWVRQLAIVGFMCAATLSYIEAYVLETWCIYCVWSQAIIATLLVIATIAVWLEGRREKPYRIGGRRHVADVD